MDQTTTEVRHYEIEVNRVHFEELHDERTGLQIKEDAIAAGARIKVSYVLDLEREHGSERVGDDTVVKLQSGMKFTAHPGGSDS
jgi:hypothetical protein